MKIKIKVLISLYLLISHAMPAAAATSCTVSTLTPVNFGNYNPFSPSPNNTIGSLEVSCTGEPESYQINLSTGNSGTYTPRKMSAAIYNLNYNLYINSARITVWGDGTSGTAFVSGLTKDCKQNSPCTHIIYGQIPAAQTTAQPGIYSDTITVTMVY